MIFVGIDPGHKGAIVKLDENLKILGYRLIQTCKNPKEFFDFISDADYVILEKSGPRRGEGVKSVFNYGFGYGYIMSAVDYANYVKKLAIGKTFVVSNPIPNVWHRYFRHALPTALRKKSASYYWAKHIWPQETFIVERCRKPHMGIVDAAMIAAYGMYAVAGLSPATLYFRAKSTNPIINLSPKKD